MDVSSVPKARKAKIKIVGANGKKGKGQKKKKKKRKGQKGHFRKREVDCNPFGDKKIRKDCSFIVFSFNRSQSKQCCLGKSCPLKKNGRVWRCFLFIFV